MPPAAPLADADPVENRPVEGPGSIARLAPRAVALLIDWALCSVIAMGLLGYRWGGSGAEGFKPLAVFAVENLLLVSTLGMTLGHRVMGMQVQRVSDGAAPVYSSAQSAPCCSASRSPPSSPTRADAGCTTSLPAPSSSVRAELDATLTLAARTPQAA